MLGGSGAVGCCCSLKGVVRVGAVTGDEGGCGG